MTAPAPADQPYPAHVAAWLDPPLSRWLWLVKWLLAIPHFVVLFFLWVAFAVLTVVAFFAILFTGRYPRAIFDFNVGVLRWSWRVGYYTYAALGTDKYPPFTLDRVPDYPATLDVDYPERLSRGLVLVKWWLLAIPHYLVVGFFVGGGSYVAWDADGYTVVRSGGGLIGLLVFFAAVVLLFRGAYPRSIFDFVLGLNRWALRVAAYASLMTDAYPPFRLDQGGADPTMRIDPGAPGGLAAAAEAAPTPPPVAHRWTAGRVVAVVLGSVGILLSLAMLAGGSAALVLDQVVRGDDGYLTTSAQRLSTSSHALTVEDIDLPAEGPRWLSPPAQLGTVRISADPVSTRPVFVGIAPEADVDAYLAEVSHVEVTRFGDDPAYERRTGTGVPAPPGERSFWAASATGEGRQTITWPVRGGQWAVVVMNADGTAGVAAEVRAGATLPHLDAFAAGLLAGGALLLALGVTAIVLAMPRSAATRPTPPDSPDAGEP
jgi:Domain of unknown function (DUF4389)